MLRASDKVSDLIFSPGRPPQIELAGKLVPVRIAGLEKLTPAHTAGIAKLIVANQQTAQESLEKTGSADLSFSVPGDARFRAHLVECLMRYEVLLHQVFGSSLLLAQEIIIGLRSPDFGVSLGANLRGADGSALHAGP